MPQVKTHPTPYATVTVSAYGLTVGVTVSGDPEEGGRDGFDAVADFVAVAAAAAEHALPTSPEFDAELAAAAAACRCREA